MCKTVLVVFGIRVQLGMHRARYAEQHAECSSVSQFFWVGQIKRRDCYKLIYGKIGLSEVPTKEKGPNGPKEIRSFFSNIFLFLNYMYNFI